MNGFSILSSNIRIQMRIFFFRVKLCLPYKKKRKLWKFKTWVIDKINLNLGRKFFCCIDLLNYSSYVFWWLWHTHTIRGNGYELVRWMNNNELYIWASILVGEMKSTRKYWIWTIKQVMLPRVSTRIQKKSKCTISFMYVFGVCQNGWSKNKFEYKCSRSRIQTMKIGFNHDRCLNSFVMIKTLRFVFKRH